MDIVFLGTPEFAVPTLRRLLEADPGLGLRVRAVVCQPDRPAGRHAELQAPAVKVFARERGLEVAQPERIKSEEAWAALAAWQPTVLVVVAYGQIIPRRVFELPPLGAINAHASLLPGYRGAAPIQWALAHGETETGVTTMRIDAGLDTGDMLLRRATAIGPDEDAVQLGGRLAEMAAELMLETLLGLARDAIRPQPQDQAAATLAPILQRSDGRADWGRPAAALYNQWRGFQPWPGLHTRFRDRQLTVQRCHPAPGPAAPPGEVRYADGELRAATGVGWLVLDEVQLEGRQRVPGPEFARGARLLAGERLA